jgi:four helix bundle protein
MAADWATAMVNDEPNVGDRKYDLEERAAKFGEANITFCKSLPANVINDRLVSQLVRSGTSVGANYCEADDAVSKKFRNKIGNCKKEARETKYWLRMIAAADENKRDEARRLWLASNLRRDLP